MKQKTLMSQLKVNEIFYSIQGEGVRIGTPNIFIRLSGCNLKCSFCDTEHNSFEIYSIDKLYKHIQKYNCKNIIWTGGEPLLQLTEDVVIFFKQKGYFQAIETNGTLPIIKGLDFISVSPKTFNLKIKKCDEVKYLIPFWDLHKLPMIKANYYFICPVNYRENLNIKNIKKCIQNVLKRGDGKWRINIQLHKILKIK